MAQVIVFVIVITLELLGIEISGGAWLCVTIYLVTSELASRFDSTGKDGR